MNDLKQVLLTQSKRYNHFHTQDALKLIYQNEFGSEHMKIDKTRCKQMLKEELSSFCNHHFYIEPIGNHLVRFHLANCDDAFMDLIVEQFLNSSSQVMGNNLSFIKKCDLLIELAKQEPDFLKDEPVEEIVHDYLKKGIRALHHSDEYRSSNCVHYRIMNKQDAQILLLCKKALEIKDKQGFCVVAIDGKCASGKTTLAHRLALLLDADVVHMDDFFLQSFQRTPERFAMIGGNFDYERFTSEILEPLKSHTLTHYQRFDCHTMQLADWVSLHQKSILIVEGSYSLHPILNRYYDISVSLTIDELAQSQRILKRNGSLQHQQFIEKWIPKENVYFESTHCIEQADFQF